MHLASHLSFRYYSSLRADVAQLVEHHLAKVDVEGSSPFIRSNKSFLASAINWLFLFRVFRLATWPSGKAEACKAFIRRFKSGRRLHC